MNVYPLIYVCIYTASMLFFSSRWIKLNPPQKPISMKSKQWRCMLFSMCWQNHCLLEQDHFFSSCRWEDLFFLSLSLSLCRSSTPTLWVSILMLIKHVRFSPSFPNCNDDFNKCLLKSYRMSNIDNHHHLTLFGTFGLGVSLSLSLFKLYISNKFGRGRTSLFFWFIPIWHMVSGDLSRWQEHGQLISRSPLYAQSPHSEARALVLP